MPSYSYKTRPNKTLAIGAGIAQGVSNAFTAYNNAKANQMKMAMMQEQMRSQAAYREAQAAALREKTMSVDMPLGDLYVLGKALKGELLPEGVVKGLMKDAGTRLVDSLKNDPSMYPYAAQRIDQVSKATSAQSAPQPAAQPAPMEPQQDPGNPYAGIRFRANPTTAKFVQGMIGNMTSQNIAAGRNQTALDVKEMETASREQIEGMRAELQWKLKQIDEQIKRREIETKAKTATTVQGMKNDGQLANTGKRNEGSAAVAGINAKARVDAAKIGANARIASAKLKGNKTGTPQDPVLKTRLKVLENEDKELGKNLGLLETPNSPFSMKTPTEKKALKEYWNERRSQIRTEIANINAPPAASPAANPYAVPKTPLVLAPQQAAKSKIVPFSNEALKSSPAGTLMKTPTKGWVESLGDGKWQPAKAPEGAE